MKLNIIAIDIAKSVFHAVVFNRSGKELRRKTLKRKQVLSFIMNQEADTVVMEACSGSHYWGREILSLGLQAALLPPQHVKAYLRGQKNDYNDACAIAEAFLHSRIMPVAVKSHEQQSLQALQRARTLLIKERGDVARQMRGFLVEFGIVIDKGIASIRKRIPEVLEDGENQLPSTMRELLHRLYGRMSALGKEIDWFDQKLKEQSEQDAVIRRLQTVPGFGPIVSTSFRVWIGDGKQFSKGRDASAALGVVPKQHSSGGKISLLGITKKGDCHLRALVIHGARAVVNAAKKKSDKLSMWINELVERRGKNKATVALANKLVRIAWAIVTKEESFRYA